MKQLAYILFWYVVGCAYCCTGAALCALANRRYNEEFDYRDGLMILVWPLIILTLPVVIVYAWVRKKK